MMTDNPLFSEVLREWYQLKSRELSPGTQNNYRITMEHFVIPALGDIPVQDITYEVIQKYLDETKARTKTLKNYMSIIRPAINMAYRHKLIRINPVYDICIPKRQQAAVQIFTMTEIQKMMAACNHEWKRYAIELGFRTGMRIGEVLALRWDDVNFEERYLIVNWTITYSKQTGLITKHPKTKTSIRRIDLDSPTLELLHSIPYNGDIVLAGARGDLRYGVYMQMAQICDRAGIRRRTFHSLRHTHASILFAQGVPLLEIQRRLGHSDPMTTLKTYIHFIPGQQEKAVEIMEQIELHKLYHASTP